MIKKVLNIKNVGKFVSFSGRHNNLAFDKNTFIYANNALGKSTLTAIFKSITTGNSDYVIGRKSFESTGKQEVNIELNNEVLSFVDGVWSKHIPIRIFDSKYISENIFSNDHISDRQRILLTNIILGKQGKSLEDEYIETKRLMSENSREKTDITNTYNRQIEKNLYSFDEFRKLQKEKDSDKEILKIDAQLKALTNQSLIKDKIEQLLEVLNLFKNIKMEQLDETVQSKREMVELHIRKNINNSNNSLKFIESGVVLLQKKIKNSKRNCSFCGQQLEFEGYPFFRQAVYHS